MPSAKHILAEENPHNLTPAGLMVFKGLPQSWPESDRLETAQDYQERLAEAHTQTTPDLLRKLKDVHDQKQRRSLIWEWELSIEDRVPNPLKSVPIED